MKNSLINFLLLRAKPAELAPHVYEAIEQRAATELAQMPVEATIDRSKLIKIGYVFLGLMLAAAIYKVSSPKDPFLTVGRIVLPWADIAPPTRVTIVGVRPGNGTVMRGQRAKFSAEVHGVSGGQTVALVYSTDDGQIIDRAVSMQVPTEGYLFECDLPEGKGGIQQDVTYRVVAGDATSNEFHLVVQAAPTIVVESVDYVYPGYTGMISQTVDHQGDLKAIEGTQVTLHALANQPIKSAAINFDCNGTDDQRMTVDDLHATATISLALKADRQTPEHTSYQLHFTNVDGKENPQPIRHQIEVTRNMAPEIQFLAPKRDEIDLPLNHGLVCEVSAHDPDFALSHVVFVGQSAGRPAARSDHCSKSRRKPASPGRASSTKNWCWSRGSSDSKLEMCWSIGPGPRTTKRPWPIAAKRSTAGRESSRPPSPTSRPTRWPATISNPTTNPRTMPRPTTSSPETSPIRPTMRPRGTIRPSHPRRAPIPHGRGIRCARALGGPAPTGGRQGTRQGRLDARVRGDQDRDQADQQSDNQEQADRGGSEKKQSGKDQSGKGSGKADKDSAKQEEIGRR